MADNIVITGAGALTPIGVGKDAFREALLRGRSGVRAIEHFDTLVELEAAPLNMVGPELLPDIVWPAGPLQADFDLDGDVDLDDFVILKSNFGTGTTHAEGDANLDGGVDLDDFVILKNEFGS